MLSDVFWCLEQCLAHSRSSMNICWVNEWWEFIVSYNGNVQETWALGIAVSGGPGQVLEQLIPSFIRLRFLLNWPYFQEGSVHHMAAVYLLKIPSPCPTFFASSFSRSPGANLHRANLANSCDQGMAYLIDQLWVTCPSLEPSLL